MSERIKLYMEDWLKTSGVVGLYNILHHAGDEVYIGENYIEFDISLFEEFEKKYFDYFIEKYRHILSFFKIISFKEFIKLHVDTNFEEFDKNSLEVFNKYIKDVLKKQMKSNSYKSAYKLIDDERKILELEKTLKTIRLKKGETIENILPDIRNSFEQIQVIIEYMEQDRSKKFIGAKNVMYTIIKNAWNGICFLNPQTKEPNMYIDYKKHFIEPLIGHLELDEKKLQYQCFTCNGSMKDLSKDLGFITSMGFDASRKPSHVWEFQNDVAICPICQLVYSCVPAGINYIYDKGIYVNDNSSMSNAIKINEKIYMEMYINNQEEKKLTYKALIEAINKEYRDNLKYELSDIQLVRFEDERYQFNILSKSLIRLFRNIENYLDNLLNSGFKEINTYFNIYELVVERMLNGQNMFTLIHKLLHYKASKMDGLFYHAGHILNIIRINTKFLMEVGVLKEREKDIVRLGNTSGYYLRSKYKEKGAVDKLGGISYKLLNALKTNNRDSFMDTLLNCYLYCKKQVPSVFLEILRSEEDFKTIGYAFVTGLIEGDGKENKEGEKINE